MCVIYIVFSTNTPTTCCNFTIIFWWKTDHIWTFQENSLQVKEFVVFQVLVHISIHFSLLYISAIHFPIYSKLQVSSPLPFPSLSVILCMCSSLFLEFNLLFLLIIYLIIMCILFVFIKQFLTCWYLRNREFGRLNIFEGYLNVSPCPKYSSDLAVIIGPDACSQNLITTKFPLNKA